jgi:hypothetical protein
MNDGQPPVLPAESRGVGGDDKKNNDIYDTPPTVTTSICTYYISWVGAGGGPVMVLPATAAKVHPASYTVTVTVRLADHG